MSNKHDDWFKKSKNKDDNKVSKEAPSKDAKESFTYKESKLKSLKNKLVAKLSVANPNSKLYKASSLVKTGYTKFRSKQLLMKILYTLVIILLFRIAASITMPGVELTQAYKDSTGDSQSFLGIMDMMGGGTLRNFSIVALGISPYITVSMLMQILTSDIFPALNRLQKSGPAGKRKINMITRVLTFIFAIIQAIVLLQQLGSGNLQLIPAINKPEFKYFVIPMVLVGGSMFILFLGEQITNKGVGNGTSLIIFSGIAVNLPSQFKNAYYELVKANASQSSFVGVLNLIFYVLVFLVLIYIIGILYIAERRVPIQQTGSGLITDKSEMQHLPIKLNVAGVMPVIFSMTIAVLPVTIAQFLHHQNESRLWIEENMRLTNPIGLAIFVALTFFFTIVISLSQFNPYNVADGFKKNGTFIPGIRPGLETENYLTNIILRLSTFSAIYLSAISALQYVEQIMGLSASISFGGTSLIILVSVSIETVSQVKARDKTQKIAKARKNTVAAGGENGGLLW